MATLKIKLKFTLKLNFEFVSGLLETIERSTPWLLREEAVYVYVGPASRSDESFGVPIGWFDVSRY